MAVNVRCNIFFSLPDAQSGWSEVWFRPSDDLNAAMTATDALVQKRSLLLGSDSFVIGARVSDEAVKRDSLFHSYKTAPPPHLPGVFSSAHPFDAYNIRLNAGAVSRRPLYLRGLPIDEWTEPAAVGKPDWLAAYNDWINSILGNSFAIRALDQSPANQFQLIEELSQIAILVNVKVPGHGYAEGDRVLLSRTTVKALDRQWTIQIVDADNFLLAGSQNIDLHGPIGFQGKCRRIQYTYPLITSAQYINDTHRVSGRPFGAPRGRRRPTPA